MVTHPRIFAVPTPTAAALGQISAWLESHSLLLLSESDWHWPQLHELIAQAQVQDSMVHDARIAALCLAHGARELWTADCDFSRFAGVRTRNPLLTA